MKSTTRFHNTNHVSTCSNKLRLMCSNGGHILPHPHHKSLCYIGGDTRMVVVDRRTTLPDLIRRLSKTFFRSSTLLNGCHPFAIKYQLPSEDLDSLITVTNDEDLENMIDEYDRLTSPSRLRLFIFPTTTPETVSLIGSVLESSIRSDTSSFNWFVDALNGTNFGTSDTSSVSCLLSLDDVISLPEKKDVDRKGLTICTDIKGNESGQDVHSIPDSVQMETSSSFGSESSTPSLANLRPIKVNSDDHQKVEGGIEELFSQISVEQRYLSRDLTGNNDRATDPNNTIEQTAKVQMQPQIQNPACLLSMATTKIDSPHNQLEHQQPQFIPPPQYIHHHHPSAAVPLASYYHYQPNQLPTDQQHFVYYIPANQLPQGYSFPLQQPQPSYDASLAATIPPSDQTILKTKLPVGGYKTTNPDAPQPVRAPYVGYSEIYQPSQLVYYAKQAMPPLSATHYTNMASISPFEAGLQEQHVRSAFP